MAGDFIKPLSQAQVASYRAARERSALAKIRRLESQQRFPRAYRKGDPDTADQMLDVEFDVGDDDTGDASDLHGYA